MTRRVEYYLSLNSPWTYLGHQRLLDLAARHGADVHPVPIDLSIVFPATGGLPLPRRAPARQAYRLVELERWRRHLGLPLNLHPAHWPADEALGAGMVIAARERGEDALGLAGACLRAVWAEDRDIGDPETLAAIASGLGLDAEALLAAARSGEPARIREAASHEAIERGVFGVPTYVLDGELFWGQDRLDFLERALGGG